MYGYLFIISTLTRLRSNTKGIPKKISMQKSVQYCAVRTHWKIAIYILESVRKFHCVCGNM